MRDTVRKTAPQVAGAHGRSYIPTRKIYPLRLVVIELLVGPRCGEDDPSGRLPAPPGTLATGGMGELAIRTGDLPHVSSEGLREALSHNDNIHGIAEHLEGLDLPERRLQSRSLMDGMENQIASIQFTALEVVNMVGGVNSGMKNVLDGHAMRERYPISEGMSKAETDKRRRTEMFIQRFDAKWQNDRYIPQSFIDWASNNASVAQKAGYMVSMCTSSQGGMLVSKYAILRNLKRNSKSRLATDVGERLLLTAGDVTYDAVMAKMDELDEVDFNAKEVKDLLDQEGMMINDGNRIVPKGWEPSTGHVEEVDNEEEQAVLSGPLDIRFPLKYLRVGDQLLELKPDGEPRYAVDEDGVEIPTKTDPLKLNPVILRRGTRGKGKITVADEPATTKKGPSGKNSPALVVLLALPALTPKRVVEQTPICDDCPHPDVPVRALLQELFVDGEQFVDGTFRAQRMLHRFFRDAGITTKEFEDFPLYEKHLTLLCVKLGLKTRVIKPLRSL